MKNVIVYSLDGSQFDTKQVSINNTIKILEMHHQGCMLGLKIGSFLEENNATLTAKMVSEYEANGKIKWSVLGCECVERFSKIAPFSIIQAFFSKVLSNFLKTEQTS